MVPSEQKYVDHSITHCGPWLGVLSLWFTSGLHLHPRWPTLWLSGFWVGGAVLCPQGAHGLGMAWQKEGGMV